MRRALGEFVIEGIQTNLDFQYDLVGTQLFLDGNTEAINDILEARCRAIC
jgi:acetyl-CoA carboxylase biotin carboxylase subunit